MPPDTFVDYAKDVFPRLLHDDEPFHVWRLEAYWNDVGSIREYRRGNFDALLGRVAVTVPGRELRLGVWVGEGTEVADDVEIVPPVLLGDGCRVGAQARLVGPLVIGDGCTIGHGAVLEGVIHWNGTATGRGASLAGGIVGRGRAHRRARHRAPRRRHRRRLRDLRRRRRQGRRPARSADHGRGAAGRAPAACVTSLGRLADGVVDLFLPKRCVACGRAGRWLCEACAPALQPLPATVCRRCGAPLATSRSDCRECRGRDLAFATARAAYLYEGPARRLVTTCKFRSLRSLVAEMADLAEVPFDRPWWRSAASIWSTWVPVHRDRDLERGFDQAALLARRLAGGLRPAVRRAPGADAPRPEAERARRRRARRQRARQHSRSTGEWSIKRVQ